MSIYIINVAPDSARVWRMNRLAQDRSAESKTLDWLFRHEKGLGMLFLYFN